ncbi:hypothetical protein LOKG_00048 [Loktanella phage pCB2051-A]|uniref:Uncharacterized protein n=1 Tax=Loktanella phage pCB2051-A TaxID=754044 RepID=M4QT02_9CAUD|nr:hypothetical protein LOKG_00048 [Loktanella phage pCB2051-A]AGH31484.1 hypothetical protein LOKG_00048 [Loktanella phage pCB2051-A]
MNSFKAKDIKDLNRVLNMVLVPATAIFIISLGVTTSTVMKMNEAAIERWLKPAISDFTFREWQKEPDGSWSAVMYLYKHRAECVYVKDQIPTVNGVTADGTFVESLIEFVDDNSPGNSRNVGWQRLDKRVKIANLDFVSGMEISGSFSHNCGKMIPTVTTFEGVEIGVDTSYPDYVLKWLNAGRYGKPEDYR